MFYRKPKSKLVLAGTIATAMAACFVVFSGMGAKDTSAAATPPSTLLGTYTTAEDTSGNFVVPAGQKPDVGNMYQAWNQGGFPTSFVDQVEAAGATPFIELEPWHMGPSWNQTPSFSSIINGQYDSWLKAYGASVKTLGKPVIFTFAHEFNVSGQYPWAHGDTGSCGSSPCSPAEWIKAWDHVESVVNSTAGGHAYWMWAPNADTGGSTTDPTPWWPGASEVQMVGVDGYPDTQYGAQFGTFSGEFGPVFSEIHKLTKLPIFISETDLAPLGGSGYESIPNFIKDLFANGGDGILEWEDGAPQMSSAQWSLLDSALAKYSNSTTTSSGGSSSSGSGTNSSGSGSSSGSSGGSTSKSCTQPATSYGAVTEQINIKTAGTYRVWSHLYAPTKTANAYLLEVDGTGCYNVGGNSAMPTGAWQWIDYQNGNTASPVTLTNLTAGTHTLTLIGTTKGLEADDLILTTSTNCVPTGDGSNCTTTTTPPPVPTVNLSASPTTVNSGSSSSLTWSSKNATACTASGAWNGSKATSGTASTGSLTSAASYKLTCTGAGGSVNASVTVNVTSSTGQPGSSPTVSLDKPVNGGTVSGTVPVSGTVTDTTSIKQVQFSVDGKVINTQAGKNGSSSGSTGGGTPSTPPATRLGIYISAENSSPGFVTTSGQHPDVANMYLAWGHAWPTQFVNQALAQGATPFIELEPWEMGGTWSKSPSTTPQFSAIDAGNYDSWLTTIGKDAKATGKPIIFTFAHEFNIGYQYPWSIVPPSSTGSSCGSSACTPDQWIKAWDHVEAVVNKAAGSNAYWMWVPNVDNSGPGTPYYPMTYWPGAHEVQMVGVDGYPSFINPSGGTFQSDFSKTFSEIHKVTKLPIFISETNLSYLGKGGFESIPSFIHDLCAAGGDGVLEYEDGMPALSSTQWSQLNKALTQCSTGTGGSSTASSGSSNSSSSSATYTYTWNSASVADGSHTISMVATNAAGQQSTDTVSVTVANSTQSAPTAPTGVTATLGKLGTGGYPMTLTWKAPINVAPSGYYIVANGTTVARVGAVTSYHTTVPADGTTYKYQIIAYDSAGSSPTSAASSVTATMPSNPTPKPVRAPTKLRAKLSGSSQVNLTWQDSQKSVHSYIIYRAVKHNKFIKLATVTSTSYGDANVNSSTTYHYYVVAIDASGNTSGRSNQASVTVPGSTSSRDISISGRVTDPHGKPIVGAEVKLTLRRHYGHSHWVIHATYTTNGNGTYQISGQGLTAGRYRLVANASGYQKKVLHFSVRNGKSLTKNITLNRNTKHWWTGWSDKDWDFWDQNGWNGWNWHWDQRSRNFRW